MPNPIVVDVHHHWMPRSHFDHPEPYLLHQEQVVREPGRIRIVDGGIQRFAPREICCNLSQQNQDMKQAGVDMAALHLGCWLEWMTMKSAPAVNDSLAESISAFPEHFIGLAHVPPLESGAPGELERAVRRLGFRGAAVPSSIHGIPLDSQELEPFYRKVCDLGIPIVVHPISAPMADEGLRDFHLTRSLGRVFEMALTTTRLLHSGVLEKFPKLRFVISHLGGAFFAIKERLAPDYYCGAPRDLFDRHMGQLYFDTAPPFWGARELKTAIEILGAEQVMLGSDYPFILDLNQATSSIETLPVTEDERRAILGENALRLFGLSRDSAV